MQVNQRQSIDLRSPYCIIGQGIPFLGDFKGEYVNYDHSWHWHSQDALLKSGTYYCSKNQGIIWTSCRAPYSLVVEPSYTMSLKHSNYVVLSVLYQTTKGMQNICQTYSLTEEIPCEHLQCKY